MARAYAESLSEFAQYYALLAKVQNFQNINLAKPDARVPFSPQFPAPASSSFAFHVRVVIRTGPKP
jgi:hypothetical protein